VKRPSAEARRARVGNVKLAIGEGQRSGKLVAELSQVNKSFGGKSVVKDLDLTVSRGDRLGLVGANGAGKTTVLKLILGTLAPDSGEVRLGTNVQVAYFDQMREGLDPEKTVLENIDSSLPAGKHPMSYLGEFLFPPRRANSPVRMLSGGERNRLLLARLFAKPANVLVLDEPTNDLDIESLELLEAALQDYAGTILLVSHDRAFLDNVVTQTLASEGDGKWKEYAGGYSDYLRQRVVREEEPAAKKSAPPKEKSSARLSYRETRELESLPGEISALEAEQKQLSGKIASPDYYRRPADALRADQARVAEIEALLMQKLERWEALESRKT
jgi:ATP-binding cassette subfamily F protein uup